MELPETLELFDRISKLNPDNWSVWKFKFEAALKQVGLWSLVVNDRIEITKGLVALDQKARVLIGLWVEDSLVPIIEHCSTAHSMWKTLHTHFENANNNLMNEQTNNTFDDVLETIIGEGLQSKNAPPISNHEPTSQLLKPVETTVDSLTKEPTTITVSSVFQVNNCLGLTKEVDDDLTKPNFLINDIGLHPMLRELDEKFLLKIAKICYDYTGAELLMATHDKHYYKLNKFKELQEIQKITGKNIVSLVANRKIFLALTDRGDLYGCDLDEDSIIEPKFVMSQVKKMFSFGETIILETDGTVLKYEDLDFTRNSERFCQCSEFSTYSIQDITSSVYGTIALTKNNRILLPEFWGTTSANLNILEHPDREDIKSIHGGFSSFLMLDKNGKAYCYYAEDSKVVTQLIPSPEAFDACYSFKETVNDYCLVSISGACYVWFGKEKKLIQSTTRSIPDTINLYSKLSMSMPNVWSELPPSHSLSKMLKELETFNNPKNHKIIITVDLFEQKEIKVQHCDYFDNQTLRNNGLSCFVANYPYSTYYQFFLYILTGKTLITKEIIGEILKLFDEYDRQKKACPATKKSRKKRK